MNTSRAFVPDVISSMRASGYDIRSIEFDAYSRDMAFALPLGAEDLGKRSLIYQYYFNTLIHSDFLNSTSHSGLLDYLLHFE